VSGFLSALAPNFPLLVLLRALMGFGVDPGRLPAAPFLTLDLTVYAVAFLVGGLMMLALGRETCGQPLADVVPAVSGGQIETRGRKMGRTAWRHGRALSAKRWTWLSPASRVLQRS